MLRWGCSGQQPEVLPRSLTPLLKYFRILTTGQLHLSTKAKHLPHIEERQLRMERQTGVKL